MPFRVPLNYESSVTVLRDPADHELTHYVRWLKQELDLAELMLSIRASNRPKPEADSEVGDERVREDR